MMFVIAGSFIFPQASQLAYPHTFSTSESAEFLSLVDQIKAEAALATMNLQTANSNNNHNNNSTLLAQAHAQKASTLLLVDNNDTLGEIREVNNRIADSLEGGLKQLEGNVTALASSSSSSTSQGQTPSPPPQDRIQSINQTVKSLDDILAEAVSARIERTQQDNATTWAMTLAHLVNVVLSDYGNATGASFDLTDLSNMASMGGGVQMSESGSSNSNNSMAMSTTTMTINGSQMQMSNNSNNTSDNNTMSMMMANNSTANSANSSSMSNTTTAATTIVDTAAYQSSQYLANNTIMQLFNDKLKPLTISSNGTSVSNNNTNATTLITEQGQNNNTSLNASNNNTMSSIDKLEAGLLQLRDDINHKATPQEVMMTAHTNIHPIIMQVYGLTLEQEEGEGHTDHDES
ncbi:MAG: hypothetical protein ACJ71B_09140 [Nitrososphaera sp.]